jgi:hypothetical protein
VVIWETSHGDMDLLTLGYLAWNIETVLLLVSHVEKAQVGAEVKLDIWIQKIGFEEEMVTTSD